MFTWIDDFDDQIVKNDDGKYKTKILEKGNSCKLMQQPTFSNKTSIKNRNGKPKKDSEKVISNQSTRLCVIFNLICTCFIILNSINQMGKY